MKRAFAWLVRKQFGDDAEHGRLMKGPNDGMLVCSGNVGGKKVLKQTYLLVLSLELVDEVVDQAVVKIFTTQMCVTSG